MRKSTDADQLRAKIELYRALQGLRSLIDPELRRLDNALNVLGSNIIFQVNNIHEDIEKDQGETVDLGQLRQDIHAYYVRPNARKATKAAKAAKSQPA